MWQWTYQDYTASYSWRVQGTCQSTASTLDTVTMFGPMWWDPSPDSNWPSYQRRYV